MVAALGLANIFIYAVPYTLSKQYTEWNTWIGIYQFDSVYCFDRVYGTAYMKIFAKPRAATTGLVAGNSEKNQIQWKIIRVA